MSEYYVYIMANKRNGTLYIGKTNNLVKRVRAHKKGTASVFTKKYNIKKIVYYEKLNDAQQVLVREKQMKKWNRDWKLRLIEKANPSWKDLYNEITGSPPARG